MNIRYTLEDTIEWMKSDDYKVRLKAEYWQLVIRMEKARNAVANFIKPELNATAANRAEMLSKQFEIMKEYKKILEKRALSEHADLDNDDVVVW